MTIHPIGIGTYGMGGGDQPRQPDDVFARPYRDNTDVERHVKALQASLDAGQNFLDTATMYGLGLTETIVGRAIHGRPREQLFIASKIRRQTLARPSRLAGSIRASLRRLGLADDALDLLYVHSPNYPGVQMELYMTALSEAVDEGLVRAIGVCNFTLEQLQIAQTFSRHPIAYIQNLYNPLFHHAGGNRPTFDPALQAYCRRQDITMIAHTPLHLGRVATHPILRRLAAEVGCTPVQLALAWIMHHGIIPIPKASQPEHIVENLQAVHLVLTPRIIALLDALPAEGIDTRGIIVDTAKIY